MHISSRFRKIHSVIVKNISVIEKNKLLIIFSIILIIFPISGWLLNLSNYGQLFEGNLRTGSIPVIRENCLLLLFSFLLQYGIIVGG